MAGFDFLHLPGPTNVPLAIQRAMLRPAEDFTGAEFTAMARGAIDALQPIFGTSGEVFCYVSNGHGVWEAVLVNLIGPDEIVLIPETGRFSESWREMAEDLGIKTQKIAGDWQSPIDPSKLEEALKNDTDHRIKAVLATHIETSTGVASDLPALRKAMDDAAHPALLVVDAVASLAVSPIEMDDNRIDCVITASQKGLMMPPGLAFVAINSHAAEAAKANQRPKRYWDWNRRRGAESYLWFYGTPPVQQMYGLAEATRLIMTEGLAARYARHRRLADAVRAAAEQWSCRGTLWFNCPKPAHRADAVTALRFADGVDIEVLRLHCRKRYQVSVAGGLGNLHGKILRIGHLGDLNEAMVFGVIGALELAMLDCGIDIERGGMDAALAALEESGHADQ